MIATLRPPDTPQDLHSGPRHRYSNQAPIVGRRPDSYGYDVFARRERSYRSYEEEEEKEITRGKPDALFTEQIERLSRMDFKSVEAEEMEEISISEDIKVLYCHMKRLTDLTSFFR